MTFAVAVLFAVFGSVSVAETVALFVKVPGVDGDFTTSAIVALVLAARLPREQVTGPAPEQEP